MIQKLFLLSFALLASDCINCQEFYHKNLSRNIYSLVASVLDIMGTTCRSFSLCQFESFKTPGINYNNRQLISSINNTAIQPRSYYTGSPSYYPAFDPISILASLAFLAFLLQSFASLFDRSRSMIPSVISSRDNSPDPLNLVLRALDEYEIFNDIQKE